jgi:hypothetical protein
MGKTIQVDKENLEYGLKLLRELTTFRSFSSISFHSSEEINSAIQEVKDLANWGMAKNKHKMKDAAMNILDVILVCEPEEPVNLNLSKYELKSIKAVVKLVRRSLEKQKDGVEFVQ